MVPHYMAYLHGKCLSSASLAVCENCPIVTFEHEINNWSSCQVVNVELAAILAKNGICTKFHIHATKYVESN